MVTAELALVFPSTAATAETVTTGEDGTADGALYEPWALIVPTVALPPAIPFTFQMIDLFVDP